MSLFSVDLYVEWKFRAHKLMEKVTIPTNADMKTLIELSDCTWIHHTQIKEIKCESMYEEIEPSVYSDISLDTPLQSLFFSGRESGGLHFAQRIEIICEEDQTKTRVCSALTISC